MMGGVRAYVLFASLGASTTVDFLAAGITTLTLEFSKAAANIASMTFTTPVRIVHFVYPSLIVTPEYPGVNTLSTQIITYMRNLITMPLTSFAGVTFRQINEYQFFMVEKIENIADKLNLINTAYRKILNLSQGCNTLKSIICWRY